MATNGSTAPAEQGLEKAAPKTPAIISTPEEYRGALLRWQESHFNILTPFTNISALAPQHGILTSLVQVNPDKAAGEVYDGLPFLKGGEVSLAKVGLRKLAECAGISTQTERTDDRRIQHYWEFKAIASYRSIDGAIVTRQATKEWDLRDGSPQMKGWTQNQIEEGRKHGLRNCEARAINAAIRECGCGIKQKYTREELKKPFVICRVMFQPDMSDPEIKRMVTAAALGGTTSLYPQAPREQLGDAGGTVDIVEREEQGEPRRVGSGSTSQAPAQTAPATPAADEPPTPDAVRIADIQKSSGQRKDKSTWTRFAIVDSRGVEHSTFSTTIADQAEKFKLDRTWVEFDEDVTDDGEFRNLTGIAPAGQQPKLPDVGNL